MLLFRRGGRVLCVALTLIMMSGAAIAQAPQGKAAGRIKGAASRVEKSSVASVGPVVKAGAKGKPGLLDGFAADLYRDPDKAASAAQALGKMAGTPSSGAAVTLLLDAIALGVSPKAAMAILDALSFHKSPEAIDTLAHYARNRNDEVRVKAVVALGETPDPRVVPLLLAALRDGGTPVRAASAQALAKRKEMKAIEPLFALLKRGDDAAGAALAALATGEIAARLADQIGNVRDDLLANALGGILMRAEVKDEIKVEIVRALGKIPGTSAMAVVAEYVSLPASKPVKPSRVEAEKLLEQRQ